MHLMKSKWMIIYLKNKNSLIDKDNENLEDLFYISPRNENFQRAGNLEFVGETG